MMKHVNFTVLPTAASEVSELSQGQFSVVPELGSSHGAFVVKEKTAPHGSQQKAEVVPPTPTGTTELRAAAQTEAFLLLERERERIARELHDDLGQLLTCQQMGLQRLEQELPLNDAQRELLSDLLFSNKLALQAARHLAHGLRSPIADSGLTCAVHALVGQVAARANLEYTLKLSEQTDQLDEAVATTLYRFLQEALTNVMRHARANHVEVVLACGAARVRAAVEDNGVGFRQDARDAALGFGLNAMQERVRALGGKFICDSQPGRGTLVCINLPL